MKNSCENCLHKGICKLEESFEYFKKESFEYFKKEGFEYFKKDLLSKPGDENFEVEFRCKKFLDKTPTLTYPEGVITIDKITPYINYGTSTNTCEGCRVYEEIKRGRSVVGDQCYYCNHNPNKITCGDTPETISINNVGTCKEVK